MKNLIVVVLLGAFSTLAMAECNVKLPAGWNTSAVEVPFDWSHPDGEKVTVSYYFKDQSQYAGKTPIVFFNGGPTMAGYSAIGLMGEDYKDENIVFLDQRGTGCSTPFKNYEGDPDVYKNYASDSIVKDAEAIRTKLFGDGKWKIFGQSYGGLISFRYIELYPASIASAHIHGFGFSPDGLLVDKREKRIAEITPELLKYKNLGSVIESLSSKEMFRTTCIETRNSLKKQFCGMDLFTGLFMVTGFKDRWKVVHKNLSLFLELIEANKPTELAAAFEKFSRTYLLRFGSVEQTAALHAITFYEMIPGKFFYNACTGSIENDLISECRFGRSFLIRTNGVPSFVPKPHDLKRIKKHISEYQVPVFYYAGHYDTFLPTDVLTWTAKKLGIESSFVIFAKSGHEGFYSEKLVIDNVKKAP